MAVTYDVYFGTESGNLDPIAVDTSDMEVTMPYVLDYNTKYYWRVDIVTDGVAATGVEWYFTSIVYDPPLPTGVTLDEDGEPTGTPNGENAVIQVRRLVCAAHNKIYYEDV